MSNDVEPFKDYSPQWWEKVTAKAAELRKNGPYAKWDDRELERRLRHTVLKEFSIYIEAAQEGHPDYMLRVAKEAARITGLTSADVSIQIGAGTAESLPDLSHLTDEQITAMQQPAIEVQSRPVELNDGPKPKRRRREVRPQLQDNKRQSGGGGSGSEPALE